MIDSIKITFYRLIQNLDLDTYRYLYNSFDINGRLVGLIGARGVGKTTMLLQYIKNNFTDLSKTLYFSADHIYFNSNSLYVFVQDLYEIEGIKMVFIDEIHKYKNWNQELKNIYDSFPDMTVVFSGSSSLDLVKGTYDLSRRAVVYKLPGLSFREYLYFQTGNQHNSISFKSLLTNHQEYSAKFSQIRRLKGHFRKYLQNGYYPFIFEGADTYFDKLLRIIDKTIFNDVANVYNLKTSNLHYFKKILNFLATIPPGKINMHNLATHLRIDDKTAIHYVSIMAQTGLIRLLFADKKGGSLIRSPEKVYLENTNLLYALSYGIGHNINMGTIRELFFINTLTHGGNHVFYSKIGGDMKVGNHTFEIGGKAKTRKQIAHLTDNAFVVKDDILLGGNGIIPLYLFGFLY
ncbi:ATP-binding protein [bacterium]|nr:ATP-binding protein [bacterium]